MLEGGDHCNFTTPVRGKCSYDSCGRLSKPRQQSLALQLLVPFFRFALGSATGGVASATTSPLAAGSFSPFAQLLERLAAQGAVQYQYVCGNTTGRSSRFETDTCATQCPPKNAVSIYKVRGALPQGPQRCLQGQQRSPRAATEFVGAVRGHCYPPLRLE